MHSNPADGPAPDPEAEFDQAVIARLYTTNPAIARWVEKTLCEDHTLTTILDTGGHALDPADADDDAVELIATAIELWVLEINGDLPMAPMVDSELETSP